MRKLLLPLLGLLFLVPSVSQAATLNFGGGFVYTEGDTISIPVLLSTGSGEAANAVSAMVTYPSASLNLVSVSKAGSIISLWAQDPSFNQAAGTAQFEGVVLNPGFSGSNGTVVTLTFIAKQPGAAVLTFPEGSVLANDGKGTEILSSSAAKTLTITAAAQSETPKPTPTPTPTPSTGIAAPKITSSTHPDQSKWYASTTVELDWTAVPGSSWIRIGYDRKPQGTPGVTYNPAIYHKELELADGIWYFHVQEKSESGWGPVATFKINIDTTLKSEASQEPEVTPSVPPPTIEPETSVSGFPLSPVEMGLIGSGLLLALLVAADIITRLGSTRRTRKGKGLSHTESILHAEFNELRDALTSEVRALEHAKTRRSLTEEEDRLIERMQKMLDRAERTIEKELH